MIWLLRSDRCITSEVLLVPSALHPHQRLTGQKPGFLKVLVIVCLAARWRTGYRLLLDGEVKR